MVLYLVWGFGFDFWVIENLLVLFVLLGDFCLFGPNIFVFFGDFFWVVLILIMFYSVSGGDFDVWVCFI